MTRQFKTIQARQVKTNLFYKGTRFFEINIWEDTQGNELRRQTSFRLVKPYGTSIGFSYDERHNSLEDVFSTILKDKDEIEKLLDIKIDEKMFTEFETKKEVGEIGDLLVRVES